MRPCAHAAIADAVSTSATNMPRPDGTRSHGLARSLLEVDPAASQLVFMDLPLA
jgi:hypothetical protein